jgi:hypothetical protein
MTSMNELALYSHMNIRYGYFGNTLPINNNTPSAMATIINMKLLFFMGFIVRTSLFA